MSQERPELQKSDEQTEKLSESREGGGMIFDSNGAILMIELGASRRGPKARSLSMMNESVPPVAGPMRAGIPLQRSLAAFDKETGEDCGIICGANRAAIIIELGASDRGPKAVHFRWSTFDSIGQRPAPIQCILRFSCAIDVVAASSRSLCF